MTKHENYSKRISSGTEFLYSLFFDGLLFCPASTTVPSFFFFLFVRLDAGKSRSPLLRLSLPHSTTMDSVIDTIQLGPSEPGLQFGQASYLLLLPECLDVVVHRM